MKLDQVLGHGVSRRVGRAVEDSVSRSEAGAGWQQLENMA